MRTKDTISRILNINEVLIQSPMSCSINVKAYDPELLHEFIGHTRSDTQAFLEGKQVYNLAFGVFSNRLS